MAAQSAQSILSAANRTQCRSCPRLWFATTTLLGAFLVFQVQPVISKCVLPWFGGTPAVWTTCMLFFQLLLFGGYVYAHLLRTLFRPAVQGAIHILLLSAAALSLPIEPSATWKPNGSESPTIYLLWMLAAHVGLPYFVLSSTGPLVQAWLSFHDNSDRVYRLYALSNAGSLAALLSYPFVVEPILSVSNQSVLWSLMFCGFVLVQGFISIGLFRIPNGPTVNKAKSTRAPAECDVPTRRFWMMRGVWIALPALASTMLLVVTNHVCQDIAVIPFLWVLPLSLYLISFIVCFDSPQWYKPKWISGVTLVAILSIQSKHVLPGTWQLMAEALSYMLMLLGVCLLCHGEVARLKPQASLLTHYYMLLSAGGAIGGLIVAILCPLVLSTHIEVPLSLAVVSALTALTFFACRGWKQTSYDWSAAYRLRYAAVALLVAPLLAIAFAKSDEVIASERNFFGVLQVLRDEQSVRLVHGTTIHGLQLIGGRASEPTCYYYRDSGVGKVIQSLQDGHSSLRIGVIGLGCGVLATYGRDTDEFDMIEINPAVVEIANTHFSFLGESRATIRTHLGDGRLVLERMWQERFDLLVLDAFSSDAIPAHLLTREAISLYRDRLTENGVLAIHVSNNHLDLVPLVHRLSADAGLESRVIESQGNGFGNKHATWAVIASEESKIWDCGPLQGTCPASKSQLADAPLWTDQRHNLLSVLRLW